MAWTRTYDGEEPIRVNKWLAQAGVCSRREAEGLIAQGLVRIDGERVDDAGRKIEKGQTLVLTDRAEAQLGAKLTVLLNKPVGYVSATPEGEQTPAVRLIRKPNLWGEAKTIPGGWNNLAPVGRLDQDSRGLLMLSEDGVIAKAVIGPDSEMEKEYLVTVTGRINREIIQQLRHGLELDGRKLKPAKVTLEDTQILRFVLQEGRNRQIRRMCQLVELRVVDLMRVRIGSLELAGLPEGKWRPISAKEREALLSGAAPRPRKPREERERPPRDAQDRPPRGERPARGDRPDRPPRSGKPSGKPGARPAGKGGPPRGDRKPDSREEKPVNPMRGAKFKRTKLGPRKRTPIK